jgi:hypothetical protein
VRVIAVKPERAVFALADTCPCPVTTAVLLDPRTDDGVFCAQAVGDLRNDLDVLQVRREIQLGAVIGLPRSSSARRGLGDRLIHDLGLPRKSPGQLPDHQIHLGLTLVVGRPWRPQDRGEAGLAGITPGPARKTAVHRDSPLDRDGIGQLPVDVTALGRRADYSRRLGSVFGEVSVVFVEPQTSHRGDRVR